MGEASGRQHTEQWADRYPSASAYLDALPDGWASFPACLARASLVGGLRDRGALDELDAFPQPLLALLDHIATDREWIPEVVHVATLLAVRDARFGAGPAHDEQFLAWMARLNRVLLGGPKLVEAPLPVTPEDRVSGLVDLWEDFHRGTPMTVCNHEPTSVQVVLTHPRQLFGLLSVESHRRTLALSLAKATPVQPHVTVRTEVSGDESRTVFTASWR